jgi:tetratricopeptide (TPR) repeat protein
MNHLGNSYADFDRYVDAVKLHEETLALRKAVLGPEHADTLSSMNSLGNDYAHVGRHVDAFKLREETLALRKAKLGPNHPKTLRSMNNLANSYADLGRHADALKLHEETLARRRAKLGADHPETLKSMRNLAWLLATCSDPKFRDPGRAVEVSKKAVELSPTRENWSTLGMAHYRAGDWKAAIAALEKFAKPRKGGDVNDYFFLAMAHGQLGEKEEARKSYDEAVQWMEKNRSTDEELRRLREEAAKLLKFEE